MQEWKPFLLSHALLTGQCYHAENLERAEEQGKIRIVLPIYNFMSLFSGFYWNYTNVFLKKKENRREKPRVYLRWDMNHSVFVCFTWNIYLYILTMSIYSRLLRNITPSYLKHCINRHSGRLAEISSRNLGILLQQCFADLFSTENKNNAFIPCFRRKE